MTRARGAALAVLGLRVAYGVGLVAAPERLARRWLGPSAATGPTQVPLRALGVRETAIHAGAIAATLRGEAVRPYLAASIVGDLSDIVATTVARRELPGEAPVATAVVAGISAALSAAVAVALDR
ncbi:hypothetical protein DSM104299_03451 [Baekduia alba]|uniref:hypothetical protein n=1 Tax=Baekduia alba TaxID=2997333 RepID=UPI00233FF685|nr:hypothetical protein [Baekduia alba]WCB94712.1 hypothetical protein DSM104299_03451 [Baekduia alba]